MGQAVAAARSVLSSQICLRKNGVLARWNVGRIRDGAKRRGLEALDVVHDPLKNDEAHCLVVGYTPATATAVSLVLYRLLKADDVFEAVIDD